MNCLSMSAVIRVSAQDCKRPIDLFRDNQASDCMRQRQQPERKNQLGAAEGIGGPSIGGTNGKHDVLCAPVALCTEPIRKSL
jgi:hypothetical protein